MKRYKSKFKEALGDQFYKPWEKIHKKFFDHIDNKYIDDSELNYGTLYYDIPIPFNVVVSFVKYQSFYEPSEFSFEDVALMGDSEIVEIFEKDVKEEDAHYLTHDLSKRFGMKFDTINTIVDYDRRKQILHMSFAV